MEQQYLIDTLIPRNEKDFKNIPDLSVLNPHDF